MVSPLILVPFVSHSLGLLAASCVAPSVAPIDSFFLFPGHDSMVVVSFLPFQTALYSPKPVLMSARAVSSSAAHRNRLVPRTRIILHFFSFFFCCWAPHSFSSLYFSSSSSSFVPFGTLHLPFRFPARKCVVYIILTLFHWTSSRAVAYTTSSP